MIAGRICKNVSPALLITLGTPKKFYFDGFFRTQRLDFLNGGTSNSRIKKRLIFFTPLSSKIESLLLVNGTENVFGGRATENVLDLRLENILDVPSL